MLCQGVGPGPKKKLGLFKSTSSPTQVCFGGVNDHECKYKYSPLIIMERNIIIHAKNHLLNEATNPNTPFPPSQPLLPTQAGPPPAPLPPPNHSANAGKDAASSRGARAAASGWARGRGARRGDRCDRQHRVRIHGAGLAVRLRPARAGERKACDGMLPRAGWGGGGQRGE